jgi:hypothetical protein
MTTPSNAAVPAGWYPDPAGSGRTRWWDGAQWTEHFQEPYSAAATAPALRASDGTSPDTPWIWAILGVMAALILPVLFVDQRAIIAQATETTNPFALTPAEVIQGAIGWVGIALFVVFGYFDYKALKQRGVPNPFHWAWSFFALITPLVYVIGRSIVAVRRTGRGWTPMWVAIGLWVVSIVVNVVLVLIPTFSAVTDTISRY